MLNSQITKSYSFYTAMLSSCFQNIEVVYNYHFLLQESHCIIPPRIAFVERWLHGEQVTHWRLHRIFLGGSENVEEGLLSWDATSEGTAVWSDQNSKRPLRCACGERRDDRRSASRRDFSSVLFVVTKGGSIVWENTQK